MAILLLVVLGVRATLCVGALDVSSGVGLSLGCNRTASLLFVFAPVVSAISGVVVPVERRWRWWNWVIFMDPHR